MIAESVSVNCLKGVCLFTGIGRTTGMDYRNGLLYAALSTSHVFYMHRIAYSSHRG